MDIKLKKKYQTYNEPEKRKNRSGYKNCKQYGNGGSRTGKHHTKEENKIHGFSGRTIGNMIRQYTTRNERKKK